MTAAPGWRACRAALHRSEGWCCMMMAETLLPTVLSTSAEAARVAVSKAEGLTPQDMADMVDLLATDVRLLEQSWNRLRVRMDAGVERSRLRADVEALRDAARALLGLGRLRS